MKLPENLYLGEYNDGVVPVIDKNKGIAVCYVTESLSKKENAELQYVGSDADVEDAPSVIAFGENKFTHKTTIKLDGSLRQIKSSRNGKTTIDRRLIICCDDVDIKNVEKPLYLKVPKANNKLYLDELIVDKAKVNQVEFASNSVLGKLRIKDVEASHINIIYSLIKDELTLEKVVAKYPLNFVFDRFKESEYGSKTHKFNITRTMFDINSEREANNLAGFKVSCCGDVEIRDVKILLNHCGSYAKIICMDECKIRPMDTYKASKTHRLRPEILLDFLLLNKLDAKLNYYPSDKKDKNLRHNMGYIEAQNINLNIRHSNQESNASAINVDGNFKAGVYDNEGVATINIDGFLTLEQKGVAEIILPKEKEVTFNYVLHFGKNISTLELLNESVDSIRILSLDNVTLSNLKTASGSKNFLGDVSLLFPYSGGDISNLTVPENNKLYLGERRYENFDVESERESVTVRDLKISGDSTKDTHIMSYLISEKEKNRKILLENCEVSAGAGVTIIGDANYKNSLFSGSVGIKRAENIENSEIVDTTLTDIKNVQNSLLSDCEYVNIESIRDYIGKNEKLRDLERLEVAEVYAKASIKNVSVSNGDKSLRDVEL